MYHAVPGAFTCSGFSAEDGVVEWFEQLGLKSVVKEFIVRVSLVPSLLRIPAHFASGLQPAQRAGSTHQVQHWRHGPE